MSLILNGKEYKAVEFNSDRLEESKKEKYDFYDELDSFLREKRYCIVDCETGEIIDDAQGYGYKSAPAAYKGFSYREKYHPNKKNKKKRQQMQQHDPAQQWMKNTKVFMDALETAQWDSIHDRVPITEETFEYILKTCEIHGPYTAKELFKAYKKMKF